VDELKVPEMPTPLGFDPSKEELLKHFADILRHYIFGQVKQDLMKKLRRDDTVIFEHGETQRGILLLIRQNY
jgi:hypothetical protein